MTRSTQKRAASKKPPAKKKTHNSILLVEPPLKHIRNRFSGGAGTRPLGPA
ncbi:MAG: hypothetical protein JW395_3004 [Nitrospira sp.]|nr:hypothetical protein [Nitrospira sp.]